MNELPDLAGKIQVGLFNIMQEGDIQIKGYPVRMPLDVLLVFTANPDDYTRAAKLLRRSRTASARRFARTIPPRWRRGISITAPGSVGFARAGAPLWYTNYLREVVRLVAFLARER